MANVKVINIAPEFEPILGFLYPDYAITDSMAVTSKFITHRTVRSKIEREALDCHYHDAIFISTQIFDELWDEEKIKQECIEFSRIRFKNRKKTLVTTRETLIKDCIDYIFGIPNLEEDSEITELFESFGSGLFPSKFFKVSERIPFQQVYASMITFISKIRKDTNSAYYKKKAMLFEDKINNNLYEALDNYNTGVKDQIGVQECKLLMSLTM